MALHVDVVKNEWLAGLQHPVARVFIHDGGLAIESPDAARWEPVIRAAVPDIDSGKDAEQFLRALHERLNGSYLFATPAHDDTECAYRDHPVVPIQSVDAPPVAVGAGQ